MERTGLSFKGVISSGLSKMMAAILENIGTGTTFMLWPSLASFPGSCAQPGRSTLLVHVSILPLY